MIRFPKPGIVRRLRILGRIGAVFLLALVLVQVAYVDHWPIVQGALGANEHEDTHVRHCHIGVSTCSDAPVSSGPGQFLTSDEWLTTVHLQMTPLLDSRGTTPRSLVVLPQVPPPQIAS